METKPTNIPVKSPPCTPPGQSEHPPTTANQGVLAKIGQTEVQTRPAGKRDTFCILPWVYLQFLSHGAVKPCCKIKHLIEKDNTPMSVYKHSFEEIWNSDDMRGIRRAMIDGESLPGCIDCYREEMSGSLSMRNNRNRAWEKGGLHNGNMIEIKALKAKTIAEDFRVPTTPSWLQLDVGNLCNLKCRMCQGYSSSRIDQDPVHRRWNGGAPPDKERFPNGKRWFEDKNFIMTELLQQPGQVKLLQFLGGETLLIKEVGDILQYLIDAGVADNIHLLATTNGTVIKSPWLGLAERFRYLVLNISIDGFGRYNEYIRYPGRWDNLSRNIEILRKRSRTRLSVVTTLQAYNALNIVELFRYLDSNKLEFFAQPVVHPHYLNPQTLPPSVRRLAGARLRSYAAEDCLPKNRELILSLAGGLERAGGRELFDEKVMREFMLFTNDLDSTRGQSFSDTHPELLQLINDTGFKWTDETLHARCVPSLKGGASLPNSSSQSINRDIVPQSACCSGRTIGSPLKHRSPDLDLDAIVTGFFVETDKTWVAPRLSFRANSIPLGARFKVHGWIPEIKQYDGRRFVLSLRINGVQLLVVERQDGGGFCGECTIHGRNDLREATVEITATELRPSENGDNRKLSWVLKELSWGE
jgi:MoaA/NifB/PqqE/SkfB family radical SAM enzyme